MRPTLSNETAHLKAVLDNEWDHQNGPGTGNPPPSPVLFEWIVGS